MFDYHEIIFCKMRLISKKNYQEDTSFPDLSYPSMRDGVLKTADRWLAGKALDDGAEGLWRIHDELYDFSTFVAEHPGGESWLRRTQGTDITEAFESHHISTLPTEMLKQYIVRKAQTNRHSPFTFNENGFYRVLKMKIREVVKTIPKNAAEKSKRIHEALVFSMFFFSVLAINVNNSWLKIIFCFAAGLMMTWTVICSHNFSHQKDNWKMYFFNFSFYPVREWRLTHGLSHHLFPNTLLDIEITMLEPFMLYLPRKSKTWFERFGPILYSWFLYFLTYDNFLAHYILDSFVGSNLSEFRIDDLLPLALPLTMYTLSSNTLVQVILTWTIIWHISSAIYAFIGLNAAHHHPEIFHDGDDPRTADRDWGLHQLSAVMDRIEINKSFFAVLTNYGEHGLHHLFPSLDHAILPYLHDTFYKTCLEFETELKMTNQLSLIVGHFRQIARTECKKNKPIKNN